VAIEKDREWRRRVLRIEAIIAAPFAVAVVILALVLNVGESVDDQCGSLLDQQYGWSDECTTGFRVATTVAVLSGVLTVALLVALVRLRPRR
jgi:ABC-type Fe3+ transport system permease subunit